MIQHGKCHSFGTQKRNLLLYSQPSRGGFSEEVTFKVSLGTWKEEEKKGWKEIVQEEETHQQDGERLEKIRCRHWHPGTKGRRQGPASQETLSPSQRLFSIPSATGPVCRFLKLKMSMFYFALKKVPSGQQPHHLECVRSHQKVPSGSHEGDDGRMREKTRQVNRVRSNKCDGNRGHRESGQQIWDEFRRERLLPAVLSPAWITAVASCMASPPPASSPPICLPPPSHSHSQPLTDRFLPITQQWFSGREGGVLSPRQHVTMSRVSFGFHSWRVRGYYRLLMSRDQGC